MHTETLVQKKEPPAENRRSRATLRARSLWILLLLAFAAGLVYLPSLRYGFVWDDRALIAENKDLDSTNPIEFFSQSFTHYWARQGLVPDAYYRPLVILSFWVERRLFGAGPAAFHLMNVLWNAVAGMLVALLLLCIGDTMPNHVPSAWPALLGGLAFALHPMHVESVAFVSDRTDLTMTVFLLLAFLAVLRYRKRATPLWGGAAILTFALSLLCKEAAVLFPVLAFLALRLGGDTMRNRGPASRRADWRLPALLVVVAAIYLVIRSLVLRDASGTWGDVTAVQRVLLVVNAFGRYFFLSLIPFWHRLTYPDLASFSSIGWPTLLGIISLVGLSSLAWRFRASARGLGAAWFVLFMLPASDFFPPGPSYLSERLLYLPTVGIVMMAVSALTAVKKKPSERRSQRTEKRSRGRDSAPTEANCGSGIPSAKPLHSLFASLRSDFVRAIVSVAALYTIIMGVNTLARLPVWKDEDALHSMMVKENPDDGKAHSNLARALKEAGDTRSALPEYRRAAELQPQSADAQYDLGEVLRAAGDLKAAATAYRKAVTIDPKSSDMQTNLGNALIELGDVQGAVAAYRQAATLNPKQAIGHNNLGVALQQVGDVVGAESEFRRALKLQPELGLALNNLGEIVMTRGKLDSAEQLFRRTVAAQPGYALGHYNLGLVLQRTGRVAEAESEYRRTLELMPGFTAAQERLKEIRSK